MANEQTLLPVAGEQANHLQPVAYEKRLKQVVSYHDISYENHSVETYYGDAKDETDQENTYRKVSKDCIQLSKNKRLSGDSSTIFVGGLSDSITEESLRSHFSRYGTIQGLRLAMDRDTGKPRGYILASY